MRPRVVVRSLRLLAGSVALLLLWQSYVELAHVPPYLLPPPAAILARLWAQRDLVAMHLSVTLLETLAGLAIGSVLALAIAVVVVHSATLTDILYPLVVGSQAVPKVALAPLLVVWFGLGIASKLVLTVLICFFPVVIGGITGLAQIDHELLDLARCQGATTLRVLALIRAPHALPYVTDSLKVALPLAMVGAITAEFVSGQSGIGTLLLDSSARLQTDLTFAAIVAIALATGVLYGLLLVAERSLLRWHRLQLGTA